MVKKSFIDYAQTEAMKSSMRKQYGCVVVYRNKIVGSGYNYRDRKYVVAIKKWTYIHSIHAERSAIMSVKNKNLLRYCKIYVVKINNNGEITGAIPCINCEKLLCKHKINFHAVLIDLRI